MQILSFRKQTIHPCSLYRGVSIAVCAGLLALLVCVVVPLRAYAQAQNTGVVLGRVTDAAGVPIHSASISLRSGEQGRVVIVKTNSQGEYIFNAVPVGTYTLRAHSSTFAIYSVTQINVNAGESVRVDAKLQPSDVSTSVNVYAGSSTVDSQSATIGFTIDPTLIKNLPLDGNNVVETAAILPGVTNVNAPTTFTSDTGGPTYNISGSRSNQNLFLLDGALWNNLYANTGLNYPPYQGLQEVSVLLNNYKAQYGRNAGSVFNVLTDSGTNALHGQIWEFAQNAAFNAADYLSRLNPPLVQNQFGATIGGPIRRNKIFFFLNFQDLRAAAVETAQDQTPTMNERGLNANGSPRPCVTPGFAGYSCASFEEDGVTTLPNPVTTTTGHYGEYNAEALTALQTAWEVAGNKGTSPCITLLRAEPTNIPNAEIPSPCFNPVSLQLLKYLPVPTTSISGSSLPYAVTSSPRPRNDIGGMARIDWILGRHTISARYYQTSVNDGTANGVSNGLGVASYEINTNLGGVHFGSIDDTWILTNNLLNTSRLAYKRYVYDIRPTNPTSLSDLGADLAQPGHSALPLINVTGRFEVGTATQNYGNSVNEDIEFDDSLSWTKGTHNFQFGAEYLRLQYLHIFDQQPRVNFVNTYTSEPTADFLLGLVQSATVGNSTDTAAIQHDVYLYAQDDWRITPRMTLSYGLRYEIPFEWYEPDGEAATFKPGYISKVFPQAPINVAFVGDPGIERSLVGTSFNNVAPRVGFAYDLFGTGRTSVRGGFGIFYDAINALVVGVSQPYHFQENIEDPSGGLSELLLGQTQIPQNYVRGQTPQFEFPFSITYPDPNFRTPYTEAFNIGFQQHILQSSTLEVNYVGRMSRHLAVGIDRNPAIFDCSGAYYQINPATYCTGAAATNASYQARVMYPNFNYGGTGALDYTTIGSASYNAAQVIYIFRARKSLSMLASYVFSKSLDDGSNATSITNETPGPSLSVYNALSDFNAQQVFNLGFTYELPTLSLSPRLLSAVLNGWSIGGLYNARTGQPFSAIYGSDSTLQDERPEYASITAGGYHPLSSNRGIAAKAKEWFNIADFCAPPSTYAEEQTSTCPYFGANYGNAPRNFLIGPGYVSTNFSLRRSFQLTPGGGKIFDFRVDAFNALNKPNLGQPGSTLAGSGQTSEFGTILATVGTNGAVGTNGRRLQLSGTLRF